MFARIRSEPAVAYALIEAVIALVIAFGLDLTGQQVATIMAVIAVLTGVGVRQQVYAPSTVDVIMDAEAVIDDAHHRDA